MNGTVKPIFWVGGSVDDLRGFPEEVRQIAGFALWQAQNGSKPLNAKPLKGFRGAGILEISVRDQTGAYRVVYTIEFTGIVYVLHAFQKKSKQGIRTPPRDLDVIKRRRRDAEDHYQRRDRGQSERKR